jgi:hypothetical protein
MSVVSIGRYDYSTEEIVGQLDEAGHSDAAAWVEELLSEGSPGFVARLQEQISAELELNPVDEESGWDETSALISAVRGLYAQRERLGLEPAPSISPPGNLSRPSSLSEDVSNDHTFS